MWLLHTSILTGFWLNCFMLKDRFIYLCFRNYIFDRMVESEVDHVEGAVSAHRGRDGLGQKAATSMRALSTQEAFFS